MSSPPQTPSYHPTHFQSRLETPNSVGRLLRNFKKHQTALQAEVVDIETLSLAVGVHADLKSLVSKLKASSNDLCRSLEAIQEGRTVIDGITFGKTRLADQKKDIFVESEKFVGVQASDFEADESFIAAATDVGPSTLNDVFTSGTPRPNVQGRQKHHKKRRNRTHLEAPPPNSSWLGTLHGALTASRTSTPIPETVDDFVVVSDTTPRPKHLQAQPNEVAQQQTSAAEFEFREQVRSCHAHMLEFVTDAITDIDRDVIQMGFDALESAIELALNRTASINEAIQYWNMESYYIQAHPFAFSHTFINVVLIRLLGFTSPRVLEERVLELRAQMNASLSFAGGVHCLLAQLNERTMDLVGFGDNLNATGIGLPAVDLDDDVHLVECKRRVLGITDDAIRFLSSPERHKFSTLSHYVKRVDTTAFMQEVKYSTETLHALTVKPETVLELSKQCAVPSMFQRHKLATIFTFGATTGLCYMLYSRSSFAGSTVLDEILTDIWDKTMTFMDEHLVAPVQNIEAFLMKRRRSPIAADSTERSRETLRELLNDFVNESVENDERKRTLLALANQCDMRAVNHILTVEIRNPIRSIVAGNLVRLLLINAERMKLDLLTAMEVMDEVLQENYTTIEIAAMIPLLVLGWIVLRSLNWLYGVSSNERRHRHTLRMLLRDVEQSLIRQASHDISQDEHQDRDSVGASYLHRRGSFLDVDPVVVRNEQKYLDLGTIMFGAWGIMYEVRNHPEVLSRRESSAPEGVLIGGFLGGVFGTIGSGSTLIGAVSGGLLGYFYVRQKQAREHAHTFDHNRFLEDIALLPSPTTSAQNKLWYANYLWKFYRLDLVLDPYR
eukprot:m.233236 g.233236  ORF g.233236 m.233236 type:complete len:840 (+) comp33637_c0_seq2:235-2754(+)